MKDVQWGRKVRERKRVRWIVWWNCVDCQERRFVIGILISVHIVVRLDVINISRICLYDSIEKSLEKLFRNAYECRREREEAYVLKSHARPYPNICQYF